MKAVMVVPGDLNTVTGGYFYDRRVLQGLRAQGHEIAHVELPASFPEPTPGDMDAAFARLAAAQGQGPLIIDGLAYGALDPRRVAQIAAPIIALVHHPLACENGLSDARRKALFATEKANLRHAAHVIVPSSHTGAILRSDYDVPAAAITIARPGTDRPRGLSRPADPPLVLSVGIQLPRKGHDVLLQALAQITDLDWQAVIVGAPLDAGYTAALQDARRDLHLTGRVTLAGQVSDADLAGFYQSATVFALATRFEGYGIVFDEALAHGLPIVSCATGAVPDTVPAGAGRLVAVDDAAGFAAALRDILSKPAMRDRLAQASAVAGAALPHWADTAGVFAQTLLQIGRT